MTRVLVAGCGYVGSALAERLGRSGAEVVGWRRRAGVGAPAGARLASVDLTDRGAVARALAAEKRFDAAVYAAAADGGDEASYRSAYTMGLRTLLDGFEEIARPPGWICFTSSTSVYHQRDGEWVDENSPTQPADFRGRILLEVEDELRERFAASTSLRLGGIYGPGRTRLAAQVRDRRAALISGPPHYTNRIHRDDAAGALAHLLARQLSGVATPAVLLGVDDEPASQRAVLAWLGERLGVELPADESGAPPVGGVRRTGSKRCRNARLRATGYAFRYPTFREGYEAVLSVDPAFPRFRSPAPCRGSS